MKSPMDEEFERNREYWEAMMWLRRMTTKDIETMGEAPEYEPLVIGSNVAPK